MKKFLSMLLMAAGLMSCGDDDKPFIPELNKLTSVTCTKNGNAFFNANIYFVFRSLKQPKPTRNNQT